MFYYIPDFEYKIPHTFYFGQVMGKNKKKILKTDLPSKYFPILSKIAQKDKKIKVKQPNILFDFMAFLSRHTCLDQNIIKVNNFRLLWILSHYNQYNPDLNQGVLGVYNQPQNDVINNNKPLEQKPALTKHMQLRRNFMNRLESSSKYSYQTDNPLLSSSSPIPVKEEEPTITRTKLYWNEHQERVFLEFWIGKLTQDPLKIYSFDNPLKRSHYFSELSQCLADNLGSEFAKLDQQCKSKFATIRRKIQKDKAKGKRPPKYGFIDYIIQQAKRKAARFPYMMDSIHKLEEMRDTDSHFMIMTKKMLDYERRETVVLKNNSIYGYLVEIDQLPLITI